MIITINGKEMEVENALTVSMLAQTMQLPERGVALAVNNKMIPRTEWEQKVLNDNDKLVIIKAACGG